jgi:hypothetical protein
MMPCTILGFGVSGLTGDVTLRATTQHRFECVSQQISEQRSQ